jgi:putative N6-adenine-specific DNA methylase
MNQHRFFATCARGLEPVLVQELQALQAADVQPGRGGVAFAGTQELLYRANLWLRTAVRVLQPILDAPVHSPEELYDAVQTLDWQRYLTLDHTFAVDCNVRDSAITHSHYAALKTKDAICDQFVERTGRRPSIDVENPMVGLNLHIYRNQMTLSLDSSGDSLHKRGYRPIQTKAPLNEALAAALILFTGWDGRTPLLDPMCGSGTIPIEACWLVTARPPGLTRKRFGFQGWLDFDIRLWTRLRDEARTQVKKTLAVPILGSDLRSDAIAFAERNAKSAGVGHLLHFTRQDMRDLQPPPGPPGIILCNPPYGERIGEEKDLASLYRSFAELRHRCPGYQLFIFAGNPDLEALIDLPLVKSIPLYNGRLSCRLLHYRLG